MGDGKFTLKSLHLWELEKRKYLFVSKYIRGGNFPKFVVGDEKERS